MPGQSCVVPKCSWVRTIDPLITYHLLPRNPERRKLWLDSCVLTAKELTQKNIFFCNHHFCPSQFDIFESKGKRKKKCLKRTAIPCKNLPTSKECNRNCSNICDTSHGKK